MPKVIKKETKLRIVRCFHHLKRSNPTNDKGSLVVMLQDIFQVSAATIFRILSSKPDLETSFCGKRGKSTFWNHVFKKDLQRLIWNYNKKNEFYTIRTLLNDAKEKFEYEGGRTTLYKILRSMGYKYKMVNGQKILCEQKHVIASRIKFLRKFLQLKAQSGQEITFVYLDETWIYQNGSAIRRWVHDTDRKSNPSKIRNEGKRFTILHAGCHLGFLDGCDYFLDSGDNDRDYHNSMNGEKFQNWVIRQLIPALAKLPGKVIVIMDNAPYHSMQEDKPPNFSAKKAQMKEWLVQHGVHITEPVTKKELYEKIKPFRNGEKKYVIDNILNDHGHEVLRLPPYHCQYNPIEMAWGHCKTYYNKHVTSKPQSKDKVPNLWRESLSQCTPALWKNYCSHTEELISTDWRTQMGTISVANVPPVIIALGESDSDSDITSESLSDSDCSSEI